MTLTVYGCQIEFNEKETAALEKHNLVLDGEYVELLLHWINVDDFSSVSSDKERHDLCIQAIESYYKDIKDTLLCAGRERYGEIK